jgi:glycosyltransferase involved in cell wall biosynthesis
MNSTRTKPLGDARGGALLIIIPCFNEELTIRKTIERCKDFGGVIELIVIDNASTDRTSEIARSAGASVFFEPRSGKGFAALRGFRELSPRHHAVLMIDGDDTYGLEILDEAISYISKGYDMVIGQRKSFLPKGSDFTDSHYRRGHQFGNLILSKLFSTFFGLKINDTLSGWRLMSPGFVRSFNQIQGGFEIETELNAHAYLMKSAIKELEVNYFTRIEGSNSKLSTYKDGLKILRRNLKLFRSERPYTAFSLLALPGFVVSFLLTTIGLIQYWNLGLVPHFPRLVAGFTLFTVSSQLWVAGMILERIRLNREIIVRFEHDRSSENYSK